MNTKALKRVLALALAAVTCVSMVPVVSLAATDVTPQPSQDSDEKLSVEYFSTTFIDYDQTNANAASRDADYKSDTYAWTNKQSTGNDYISLYDLIKSNGEYQKTDYFISPKNSGEYYPAYVTKNGNNYYLYYLKDGDYVLVDQVNTSDPDRNYFVDKPSQDKREGEDGAQVETCGNRNAYRVNLYKYEATDGAYEGKGFYFTGATGNAGKPDPNNANSDEVPLHSKAWGYNYTSSTQDQDFFIYSGIVADKLSESTNVPFDTNVSYEGDETVNAAPGFFSTDPTVGTDYRTVYTNVGLPFVYNAETGYYTLNTDKNGVYFANGVGQSGVNMMIADKPIAMKMNGDGVYSTGLTPFVGVTSTVVDAQVSGYNFDNTNADEIPTTEAYFCAQSSNVNTAKEQLFAFGMVTEVKFQMTDDGKSTLNGEDVVFNFSGDDDVWIYVDGVLALDIGGVHDAIQGNINFATGDVTVTATNSKYGKVGDRAKNRNMNLTGDGIEDGIFDSLSQGNIYEKLETTLTGFAAQGEHTLTVFYMDRGEGKTNCVIEFNLPQRDTVEVTKKVNNAKDDAGNLSELDADEEAMCDAREFGFTLYKDGEAVANKTYYVYDSDNNLIGTASTDANGHFILKRNQTARFLVDLSKKSGYHVVEDEMSKDVDGFLTPKWTCTSNITDAEVGEANGFTGMTVTATGSDTTTDTISFVCENYLSANIPNPGILANGERIVIDYGLPITINVSDLLKNDLVRGDTMTLELSDNGGDFGTAVYNDNGTADNYNDDTITYTLNKQLTGIEKLTYKITVTGEGNEGSEEVTASATGSADIQIMPATSMYYEENFGTAENVTIGGNPYVQYGLVSYSDGATKWEPVGTALTDNQETGFVGTAEDSTYGSDAVYLSNLGDSYGTSMKATADEKAALFAYDFTGTGTAIYGRVSAETGYIRVKITDNDNNGEQIDLQYIDTVELTSVGGATTLYNIPIYLNNSLDHGNYHVEVMLYQAGTPTTNGDSGAEFYLDGIRIYNPVIENETVNTAYADDGEANTVVLNIRDKIIGDIDEGYVEDVFTLTDQYGEIIDNGTLADGDANYDNYAAYGPNHEFYLNAGDSENAVYTVSFKLINWDSQLYKLYLGMKAPSGNAATVTVGGTDIILSNSADCYYDISNYISVETVDGTSVGTVTITGKQGLVSLTNIKVTGVEEFSLGASEDLEDVSLDANVVYMVPATYSLRSNTEEEPVETFEPEQFDISCSYSRFFKSATVMVSASSDVSYVTVNGVQVNAMKLFGKNTYIYNYRNAQSGSVLDVVAYNSDGVASEVYTITVK